MSAALQLSAELIQREWNRTVQAIDRIHGDGELSALPVEVVASLRGRAYGVYLSTRAAGFWTAVKISIRRGGDWPSLSLAHEIGHFLDQQALGDRGGWASETSEALREWREAVTASAAFKKLVEVRDGPDVNPDTGYTENKRYLRYATQLHEAWARSYAQYIATRSGDAVLTENLGRAKQTRYTTQWQAEDFEPIAQAMDRIFLAKGWLTREPPVE